MQSESCQESKKQSKQRNSWGCFLSSVPWSTGTFFDLTFWGQKSETIQKSILKDSENGFHLILNCHCLYPQREQHWYGMFESMAHPCCKNQDPSRHWQFAWWCRPNDLSLIPQIYRGRKDSQKLSSDLHLCTIEYVYLHPHINHIDINTIRTNKTYILKVKSRRKGL